MNKTYGTHNLISESTFHKLPPDGYVMRPIDFVDMSHGSADPEPVYEAQVRASCRDREALSAGSNVESDESAGFPDARAVLGAVEREDYLRDDKHNGHSILPRKGTGNWLFARIQGQEKDR
eukprot:s1918_g12.t1